MCRQADPIDSYLSSLGHTPETTISITLEKLQVSQRSSHTHEIGQHRKSLAWTFQAWHWLEELLGFAWVQLTCWHSCPAFRRTLKDPLKGQVRLWEQRISREHSLSRLVRMSCVCVWWNYSSLSHRRNKRTLQASKQVSKPRIQEQGSFLIQIRSNSLRNLPWSRNFWSKVRNSVTPFDHLSVMLWEDTRNKWIPRGWVSFRSCFVCHSDIWIPLYI